MDGGESIREGIRAVTMVNQIKKLTTQKAQEKDENLKEWVLIFIVAICIKIDIPEHTVC